MAQYTKRLDELNSITTIDQANDKLVFLDGSDNNLPKLSTPDNFVSQIEIDAAQITSGTVPDARFPATLPVLNGSNLTNLNANNLSSGTLPDARFPAILPAIGGGNITGLNANNLGAGTIPDARFPATLPVANGSNLTNLNANNLSTGTIPDTRFPAILPVLNGSNLTDLNGGAINTGTVADIRIASTIARKKKEIKNLGSGTIGLASLADGGKILVADGGSTVNVQVTSSCAAGDEFIIVNNAATLTISTDGSFTGYYTDTGGLPQVINPSTSISPPLMSARGFVARIYVILPGVFILEARNL